MIRIRYYNKDSNATFYYVQEINSNSLDTLSSKKLIGAFAAKAGGFLRRAEEAPARFLISKDTSKFLMVVASPYEKNQNQKFYFSVFYNNMNKLWEKIEELPFISRYVDLLDYFVTNNGEVGVLFKHYDQDTRKEAIKVVNT